MSIIYCIAINTCTHTLTRVHTLAAAGVKENEVQRNLNEIQYIRKNQSNFISYLWDKAKESRASSAIKCNSTHVYSEKEKEEKNKPKARYLHALWFNPHGSLIIDQAAEWHFKWYWMKMQSSKVILSGYVRCLSLIATIIHTQNGIPHVKCIQARKRWRNFNGSTALRFLHMKNGHQQFWLHIFLFTTFYAMHELESTSTKGWS